MTKLLEIHVSELRVLQGLTISMEEPTLNYGTPSFEFSGAGRVIETGAKTNTDFRITGEISSNNWDDDALNLGGVQQIRHDHLYVTSLVSPPFASGLFDRQKRAETLALVFSCVPIETEGSPLLKIIRVAAEQAETFRELGQ